MTTNEKKEFEEIYAASNTIEDFIDFIDQNFISKEVVREVITESQWECSIHGLPKFEKDECIECNEAREINVVLLALLSSLKLSNTKE